jgi:transcriptional regulator with XRE-family HTH domain
MPAPQNIVGSQIKTLRREKRLTQAMLAARCGWDVSENVITKIETHIRCVTEIELLCIATALNLKIEALLPPNEKSKAVVKKFFLEHRRDN